MLRAFFAIRPTERRDTWTAFAVLFGFLASHSMLETARDALFLSKVPATRLPWVYLAIAAASLLVTQSQARFGREFAARSVLSAWTLIASGGTLAFWSILRGGPSGALGSAGLYGLYVWSGVLASLVLVHFWSLLGDVFTVTQAKRLYGIIGAGSVLGAIAGSGLASGLARRLPPDRLLLASAVGFAATAVVPTFMRHVISHEAAAETAARRARTVFEDARFVARQPYAARVALLLIISTSCVTVADYVFKSTIAATVPAAQLGTYFATLYFALNVASLVCQVVLVGWLLRRFDLSIALAVLPVLLALGGVGLALGLGLGAALFVKGADGSLRYSLHRTASELLFVPFSDEARRRVKALIDVLGQRGGQAAASLVILLVGALAAPPAVLATILVLLASTWAAGAIELRRHYLDIFRRQVREGRIEHAEFPELDVASLETLIATLDSDKDAEVVAALDVIERERKGRLVPALILYHPSEDVVVRALALFSREGRTNIVHFVDRLLEHPSVRVRAAAVAARAELAPDPRLLNMRLSLEESPEVRATIVVHLIASGEIIGAEAEDRLDELLRRGSPATRIALANAVMLRDAGFERTLVKLVSSIEPEVRLAAAQAMARRRSPEFIEPLLDMLAHERTRRAARHALLAYDREGFEAVRKALTDPNLPQSIRWHLPKALAQFDPQKAASALLEHLPNERDGMVRYRCIRALEDLVAAHPSLEFDEGTLNKEIDETVARAYRYLDRRLTLELGALRDPRRATRAHKLLARTLRDKEENAVDRLFRLLALAHPLEDFVAIHRGIRSQHQKTRASCVELVENVLDQPLRSAVIGLVDDTPDADRLTNAASYHEPLGLEYDRLLEQMLGSTSEAIQDLTAFHVAELGIASLRNRVARLIDKSGPRADLVRALSVLDATQGARASG